jgi:hypothetical protein
VVGQTRSRSAEGELGASCLGISLHDLTDKQLSKSLVLRTHAKGYEIVQLLVDLLQDEKWGSDAAKAFQIITSDDELLNKANHTVIRLLYKQRLFNHIFPKLVTSAASQQDDSSNPNRRRH